MIVAGPRPAFYTCASRRESSEITGPLDDQAATFRPQTVRAGQMQPFLVGFYLDLSRITPDLQHTIPITLWLH